MKKVLKRIFLTLAILLGVILLAAVVLFTWLTITEFRPKAQETVSVADNVEQAPAGEEYTLLSWNVGYCALGKESEFFMDGGKEVRPDSESVIHKNYDGILDVIQKENPDFLFLQEVDSDSKRSYYMDEVSALRGALEQPSAYALNYKCNYVPYPLPTLGKVTSGLLSFSRYRISEATRISLPCPFSWPVSVANLKRCLLVTRVPLEGREQELVLVNLHLEAYDDGEGKKQQTEQLLRFLQEEYEKGNYVIAGGDWNQVFPKTLESFPNTHEDLWTPGVLEAVPEGWAYAYDVDGQTCRLLNKPYDPADKEGTQYYVIDDFLVSPNVEITDVKTLTELDFEFSDHNPVQLKIRLGA